MPCQRASRLSVHNNVHTQHPLTSPAPTLLQSSCTVPPATSLPPVGPQHCALTPYAGPTRFKPLLRVKVLCLCPPGMTRLPFLAPPWHTLSDAFSDKHTYNFCPSRVFFPGPFGTVFWHVFFVEGVCVCEKKWKLSERVRVNASVRV